MTNHHLYYRYLITKVTESYLSILRFYWRSLTPLGRKRLMYWRAKYKEVSIRRWRTERSADAFFLSFPKCGRTWVRLMLSHAIERHFGLTSSIDPALNEWLTLPLEVPKLIFDHDDEPFWKKPEQLNPSKSKYKDKRVVLLVRDPRDVVVSAYFHVTKRKKTYSGTLSDFIYEPVGSFDTLIRFLQIWDYNQHVPQGFLLVRYEDFLIRPHHELRRLLDFLGLSGVSDEVIEQAVAYAAFGNMRRMEEIGKFESGVLRPKNKSDAESYKTRRGQAGGFINYLSASEVAYLSQKMQEQLPDSYGYCLKPAVKGE